MDRPSNDFRDCKFKNRKNYYFNDLVIICIKFFSGAIKFKNDLINFELFTDNLLFKTSSVILFQFMFDTLLNYYYSDLQI